MPTELIQIELKYCERCGGLWLRRKGSQQIYCASCAPFMADLPQPVLKRPVGCVTKNDIEALADDFAVCCAEAEA